MNHITNINLSNSDWNTTSEDLIVTGVYEEKTLSPQAKLIDSSTKHIFTKAIESGDVNGKVGTSHTFYYDSKILVLIGLGSKKKL